MLRRTLVASVVAILFGVLAPLAAAVSVSVRVEGKTRTIFGAAEPKLVVEQNPFDALVAASQAGEFYFHVAETSFGAYVDQIGLYPSAGLGGWVFKVNGVSPPVGADAVTLEDGDRVLWYWADFDAQTFAGPKTLFLKKTKANCYTAVAEDDKGATTPAAGAVLHVGSKRTVATKDGAACVGPHRGLLVRATLAGAVRSNALA